MSALIKLALACLMVGLGYFIACGLYKSTYNEGYNKGAQYQDSIHRMTEGWIEGGEIPDTLVNH